MFFLQSFENYIQRRSVELVTAAIDVAQYPTLIDYQRGWVGDVESVGGERVMESVGFGHDAILIEQKDAGDGMFLQEFSRLPYTVPFFGSDERQLCSGCFNFRYPGLELSHAFHAIRSPGAAQKLENERSVREQTSESEYALAVGRSQRKIRGARPDFQSVGAVFHVHVVLTLGDGEIGNNNGWGTGDRWVGRLEGCSNAVNGFFHVRYNFASQVGDAASRASTVIR
jgi:hypothetical protein